MRIREKRDDEGVYIMKLNKIKYNDSDFFRVRDFLSETYKSNYNQHNWLIDRWNFCRYFAQAMHNTFDTWPETVGIWVDDEDNIRAVVNSEGENRGEAFFQLAADEYPSEWLLEFIEHAETHLRAIKDSEEFINVRVNQNAYKIKDILGKRGYSLLDWMETTASLSCNADFKVNIPAAFTIAEAGSMTDYQQGFAHGRAFGYYKNEKPDDNDAENAFSSMKKAPDYNSFLDLSIIDDKGEIVAFANIWYDKKNQLGILEPVGTIPTYRKMGLGKAVIYEGINRVKKLGANKMYVGSDQQFYKSIGFSVEYEKEIWQLKWR